MSLKNVFHWIVLSSNDPADLALTVKGFLLAIIPGILIATGAFHVNVDSDQLTQLVDAIVNAIQDGLVLVGITASIIGIVRKIYLSATGRNQAVLSPTGATVTTPVTDTTVS